MKERKKGSPKVGPLKEGDGSLISDKGRMSELFVGAFAPIFVEDDPERPHEDKTTDRRMDNICIRYSSVREVLLNLDSSSSAGPCAEVLS